MPRTPMSNAEDTRLLADCELLRVAFRDGDSTYLIPLGCVCINGVLYGVTDPGRKTEIATAHPRVSFQADTARQTGLFEWESVTGRGVFAIVSDAEERSRALSALQAFIATAPDWWKAEQGPKMASGQLLVWRIQPVSITGVRYAAMP